MKVWRASLPWFPFAESLVGALLCTYFSCQSDWVRVQPRGPLSLQMSHSEVLRVWDLNMELGIRGLDQSLTLGDGSKGQ